MKTRINFTFLMVLCFTGHLASAKTGGGQDGNGGDVSVCRNGSAVTSVELLDYFEARQSKGWLIKLNDQLTWQANLQVLLSRIAQRDPDFKEELQNLVNSFESEASFLSGIELVDIPDSKHLIIPAGCKIEQIAIQREPKFKIEPYYTINRDLWLAMTPSHQAGLVLHEVLYRYYLKKGMGSDSTVVRYFNGLISSDKFSELSIDDYFEVMLRLGVSKVRVGSLRVKVQNRYNDRIERIIKSPSFAIETATPTEFTIADNLKVTVNGNARIVNNGRWDGQVQSIETVDLISFKLSSRPVYTAEPTALKANPVTFKFEVLDSGALQMIGIFWVVSKAGRAYRCHQVNLANDSGQLNCNRDYYLSNISREIAREIETKYDDRASVLVQGTDPKTWTRYDDYNNNLMNYRYVFDRNMVHLETSVQKNGFHSCVFVMANFDSNDLARNLKIPGSCYGGIKVKIHNYVPLYLRDESLVEALAWVSSYEPANLAFSPEGYYIHDANSDVRIGGEGSTTTDTFYLIIQNQKILFHLVFNKRYGGYTDPYRDKEALCNEKGVAPVTFYPNGRIKQGVVATHGVHHLKTYNLKTISGQTVRVLPFDELHFDEKGNIIKIVEDICLKK